MKRLSAYTETLEEEENQECTCCVAGTEKAEFVERFPRIALIYLRSMSFEWQSYLTLHTNVSIERRGLLAPWKYVHDSSVYLCQSCWQRVAFVNFEHILSTHPYQFWYIMFNRIWKLLCTSTVGIIWLDMRRFSHDIAWKTLGIYHIAMNKIVYSTLWAKSSFFDHIAIRNVLRNLNGTALLIASTFEPQNLHTPRRYPSQGWPAKPSSILWLRSFFNTNCPTLALPLICKVRKEI